MRGANMVSQFAHTATDRRPFALQKQVYAQLKARGLSAQPAIRVIKKVADAYATRRANLLNGNYGTPESKRYAKVAGKAIVFREDAGQPFDDRCLSWRIDRSTVSIWTTEGRMRNVGFVCAPWQLKMLADRKGESDLIFRDGSFYLHATVDTDAPDQLVPRRRPHRVAGRGLGDREPGGDHRGRPGRTRRPVVRWCGHRPPEKERNHAVRAAEGGDQVRETETEETA